MTTGSVALLGNKKVRAKVAGCDAVGLSYWADHPAPSCVWAADGCGQFHVVRINYKVGTAAHWCPECVTGDPVPFTDPAAA